VMMGGRPEWDRPANPFTVVIRSWFVFRCAAVSPTSDEMFGL
jgi:hypothetical protein